MGALGASTVTAACSGAASDRRSAPTSLSPTTQPGGTSPNRAAPATRAGNGPPPACTLTPELTEGPFYLDLDLVRRDITEGRPGTPLRVTLTVVAAGSCNPLPNVAVDVWHCDANGDYSPRGSTFLRGTQLTDEAGSVSFDTIYPGYYRGRAVHIHFKVHPEPGRQTTSQLFFPDELNNEVLTQGAYASRGRPDMPNERDSIFQESAGTTMAQLTRSGNGFAGALTVGLAASPSTG